MSYESRGTYPQNSSYKPNNQFGSKPKPAYQKAAPKKKELVKVTRTSMVQDMFLESMQTQGKTLIVRTASGEVHTGQISHFDLYIIVLGPVSAPTLLYKSAIESIKLVGDINQE